MLARKSVVAAALAIGAGLFASAPGSAHPNFNKTMYLTFNRSVQLPGVTLSPGNYTFELPEPFDASDVVRVSNRTRDHVYFTGLTHRVARPADFRPGQIVSFGEAEAGAPLPIRIWYPVDDSEGRQFIYAR
jgi:hypothetical protein